MELKFCELPLNTQMDIAPELREYYDQVTYDTANEWLVYYSYGAVTLWSSFELHRLPENDHEFENHKLALFMDAISLYRIKGIKEIEFVAESRDESYQYMNVQINGDLRLLSEDVCKTINRLLEEKHEVPLEKADFTMNSRYVHILHDVAPFRVLKRYNKNEGFVQKVIVSIKCGMNIELDQIEQIKKMIEAKFVEDITIIFGISEAEKETELEVDIFIYSNEEYISIEIGL